MKNILLLGDSIRLGYDAYVKDSIQKIANVYYPSENCMFAAYILRFLHCWKDSLGIDTLDAVHWNAGHWDTVRIYGDDPLTRPDVYADYIERIINRIAFLFPGAKIIFATSTPVIEDGFIKEFEYRANADVELYNRIAAEVCRRHGVAVNDLYGLLRGKGDALHSDQTHYYTADATELIGRQVSEMLCEQLQLDKSALIKPDKSRFAVQGGKNDRDMYTLRGKYYERTADA